MSGLIIFIGMRLVFLDIHVCVAMDWNTVTITGRVTTRHLLQGKIAAWIACELLTSIHAAYDSLRCCSSCRFETEVSNVDHLLYILTLTIFLEFTLEVISYIRRENFRLSPHGRTKL